MKTLVLLAGNSEEFHNEGYKYPKYLVEIEGKPLVEHVINKLKSFSSDFIFIINSSDAHKWHFDSVLKLLCPNSRIIISDGKTKGAACTALYAIDHINDDNELMIANGDQILNVDWQNALSELRKNDGGTVIFESVHPRWSYVALNEKRKIVQAEEKRPISKHATAGVYYFKKGKYFVEGASNMLRKGAHVNDTYYICPVFNELILKNFELGVFEVARSNYHSLANVDGVKEYTNFLQK